MAGVGGNQGDAGLIAGGVVMTIAGSSILIAGGVSGLVRRGKRGHYQRRIEKYKGEIEALESELGLSISASYQGARASLTLRF